MKKLLLLTVILILFAACGDGSGDGDNPLIPPIFNDRIPERKYWARNMIDNSTYEITAKMLANNNQCEIWVEEGSGIKQAKAQEIANKFSTDIYPKMKNAFSIDTYVEGVGTLNTIQYANAIASGELSEKITILLLDIWDGYEGPGDVYVGGYFTRIDFFSNEDVEAQLPGFHSNERAMIYLDTYPTLPPANEDENLIYRTAAHEMQHLMNFTTTIALRSVRDEDGYIADLFYMDTWIDEGLSSAAEYIFNGTHSQNRIEHYISDSSGLIKKGNNFFIWDNRDDESPKANLDDYSTVYMFFQWLRLRTGSSNNIYKKIITSEYSDYQAVTRAYSTIPPAWETLLGNWFKANYSPNDNTVGYRDTAFNNVKVHYAPSGSNTITLYPGEGVYSYVSSSVTVPVSSGDIVYAGLGAGSGTSPGGAWLTYNKKNTGLYYYDEEEEEIYIGGTESGQITGAAPPQTSIISGSYSVMNGVPRSFPISMADMLRRNGHGRKRDFTNADYSKLLKGILIE